MSLIVQKYGGTSMGSPDRIREVARRVERFVEEGHQVVVVVSAMSGETNRLLALAKELYQAATLDDGDMWPTAWALTKLTAADEARIAALVTQAVS